MGGDVVESSVTEVNVTPEYHNDQYVTGLNAVWDLIGSGAFGDPTSSDLRVSLSGHGNPNHEPLAGWANDGITITIYQIYNRSEDK